MNSLDDLQIIQELYRASRAGVQIDLIVRGLCRLRPGLKHYSENIRVISIIGHFLEHSRIYYFNNNGSPFTCIGSADWQRRNLDDRVEVIVPVEEESLKARLRRILDYALSDNRLAWDLRSDGQYVLRRAEPGEEERSFHDILMLRASDRMARVDKPWDIGD
jgi:polyphosphate kinase